MLLHCAKYGYISAHSGRGFLHRRLLSSKLDCDSSFLFFLLRASTPKSDASYPLLLASPKSSSNLALVTASSESASIADTLRPRNRNRRWAHCCNRASRRLPLTAPTSCSSFRTRSA